MPFEYRTRYFDTNIINGRVMDIFEPFEMSEKLGIFMIHGGGWEGGTRTIYHKIMRAFNDKGFICASTDYRLSKVTILDQMLDVYNAYSIFSDYLAEKHNINDVFVIGSSAGGHLALLLTLAKPERFNRSFDFGDIKLNTNKWKQPIGAAVQSAPVLFEPWEDIFPEIWNGMQKIVGVPYETNPENYKQVSPVEYVSNDSPPILLLEAQNEHVFSHEFSEQFVKKMKVAGRHAEIITFENAEHGFFYDVTRKQQKQAFQEIIRFMKDIGQK